MKNLSRWAVPLPANHNGPLKSRKHYAAITFCDGFMCFLEKALPELERYNIPASVFIPVGYIGRRPGWETDDDRAYPKERELMSGNQLRSLPPHLVTVGSHGLSHKNLASLGLKEAEDELRRSKYDLERILQRQVNLFFFPYGETNEALLALARDAGYERVFCNKTREAFREPNEFLCGAIISDPEDWSLEFVLKVRGGYCWLSRAIRLKRSLKDLLSNRHFSSSCQ
jgi:peptidoglycan/xylan/chitin deacetylase (PgdA/CDA1 family)